MIMINDYDQKSYMIIYDIVMNMIDNHIICLLFQTLFWLSRQWSCCLVTGTFDWIWWKWMWILFICCCKFIWICCTWHICESIFRDAVRGVVVDDVFVRSQKYSFICIDFLNLVFVSDLSPSSSSTFYDNQISMSSSSSHI